MDRELVAAGITEVAVGALTGWPLAALIADPALAERLGGREVHRLRQAHVDLIMMGGLVAAAGLVDDAPAWATRSVKIGAWTNPLLFVPVAVRPGVVRSPAYVAATLASFAVTCAGWVGLARAARRQARPVSARPRDDDRV